MNDIIQILIYGMVLGSVLSMGAIGVSMIFGILRFAHFAHGDFMTLGAYIGLTFIGVMGLSPWFALPAAMVGMAVVAVVIDQLLYRRIRRTQPVILLISSFGMALILRSLIQLIWGSENQTYASGIQFPWRLDVLGGLRIKPDHVWIVLISLGLVAGVHLFLTRTRMGKAMRAMSDNMDLALVSGIPAERVIIVTWIIGGALAAAAGVFLGIDTRLHPVMGWTTLLPVFAAAILGGIGRPYGAIVGGMIIGISMEMSTLFISAAYKPAVAFAIMVVMLIFRPQGIFKGTL
ncbi:MULTISPECIES: branched-chain amino acid ABC transporter permease [Halomonadaceae]|uniref:Branched-chain amino acid transport system permease protein/neutral amino acid transport system permease protein n=1 Tax=Onishia taeanensis TaxID=284577 RepID=A0A328XUP5_9GAMM|nr:MULTISPECIES: branched-chain amino acid ABC transporter permease [Halomonas]RAR63004.1 branched-chain amino acid transport system permease protein/neutral amino acid transport system permease protein [Halomonas taeanensis]